LLSLVLSDEADEKTARWVETQRNLVNVAVSRAKQSLVVFGDATVLRRYPVPTAHALVAAAQHVEARVEPIVRELHEVADLHSEAEQRLFAALLHVGLTPISKPRVEGYELDFAVDAGGILIDVEVDGTHHLDERGRQRRQDLARDLIIEGLGWRVLRFPAWLCLSDPEAAAAAVVDFLRVNRDSVPR